MLKPLLHNTLTGKLSDFAGLLAFVLFWNALIPRHRATVAVASAAGFMLWKSPAVQPLIEGWNALDLPRMHRVVDATDLLALSVIPFAYMYRRTRPSTYAPRAFAWVIAAFSVFLFAATQTVEVVEYDASYSIPMAPWQVRSTLSSLQFVAGDTLEVVIRNDICAREISARVLLTGNAQSSHLRLLEMTLTNCDPPDNVTDMLRRLFEDSVVTPLRAAAADSAHVSN